MNERLTNFLLLPLLPCFFVPVVAGSEQGQTAATVMFSTLSRSLGFYSVECRQRRPRQRQPGQRQPPPRVPQTQARAQKKKQPGKGELQRSCVCVCSYAVSIFERERKIEPTHICFGLATRAQPSRPIPHCHQYSDRGGGHASVAPAANHAGATKGARGVRCTSQRSQRKARLRVDSLCFFPCLPKRKVVVGVGRKHGGQLSTE